MKQVYKASGQAITQETNPNDNPVLSSDWPIASAGGRSEVWNQPDVVTTCDDEALSIFKPGSSFANWTVS